MCEKYLSESEEMQKTAKEIFGVDVREKSENCKRVEKLKTFIESRQNHFSEDVIYMSQKIEPILKKHIDFLTKSQNDQF